MSDKITDKQLLAIADHLNYTRSICSGRKGWQLKALTVAHCMPSTHVEALVNSKRLVAILNKSLEHTKDPRLHYAKHNTSGIDSRFSQGSRYYPGKFGSRSKLGLNYTFRCVEHGIQYFKCSASCKAGICVNGEWVCDIVNKNKRRK